MTPVRTLFSANATGDTGRAMSRENVEIVRRAYSALSSLDADSTLAFCDPEVEFASRITAMEGGTYRGYEGVRRFVARLQEAFEWIDIEPLEVLGDGDRVVVTNRFRACGVGSGAEVEQRFFHAIKLRDGKAIWWSFFDSKGEALEAVGLEE